MKHLGLLAEIMACPIAVHLRSAIQQIMQETL